MGICERVASLCVDLRWTPERLRCRCRTDEYVAYRIVVARALYIEGGYTQREIGRALCRERSTVSHYLRREEIEN